ncbi:MAG: SUMF1/EgtB/PvdO family nonheme iron enzyme [Planctomycetes bacterium]|nr:SUMF1/EgtB/PvdO family nonheme iron enzyme [Planctomycetota bacterium]
MPHRPPGSRDLAAATVGFLALALLASACAPRAVAVKEQPPAAPTWLTPAAPRAPDRAGLVGVDPVPLPAPANPAESGVTPPAAAGGPPAPVPAAPEVAPTEQPAAESLAAKMRRYEEGMEQHHVNEGVVMPRALFPPEGRADHSTGHPEDGCTNTGQYLAALSFQYRLTMDPTARVRAENAARGLERLERVTGRDGCFARMLKRTGGWTVDEEWFFFPHEWHDSASLPGYRWLGDPSSDALNYLLFGCAIYFDLAASPTEQQRVAALVERVMSRVLRHDLRIVDVDGKMTLWGNLSPTLPHQPLNALLALAHLRIAHHVTGDTKYLAKYGEVISRHGYLEQALAASVTEPEQYVVPWDDALAYTALYNLLRYEHDAAIRDRLLRAMERFWLRNRAGHRRPLYDFIYQANRPDVNVITSRSLRPLIDHDVRPRRYVESLRTAAGPVALEGTWQESAAGELLAYWLGRYHGLIPAVEEEARRLAAAPDPRAGHRPGARADWGRPPLVEPGDGPYRGMVRVPAGPFVMGSDEGDPDERPRREVTLPEFFIDRYEVTHAEYARVLPDHHFEAKDADRPVTGTFSEAAEYARRAGKRLPTEAEWEKAARGVDGRLFPWGAPFDWTLNLVAWDDAEPVGLYPAGVSPFGCFDVAGNVWEWTADDYQPRAGQEQETGANTGPTPLKVIKGGAGFNDLSMLRPAHKYAVPPDSRIHGHQVGFRCVKDPPRDDNPGAGKPAPAGR